MAKNIEKLAKELGAEIVGQVPDYSPGAFGVAKLGEILRSRLEPGQGKRPGRPSNPDWEKRSKIPMSVETEKRLDELASLLSEAERQVSRTQVAAQLLEDATAQFFSSVRASDAAGNVKLMTVYFQGEEWDALQSRAEKEGTSEANVVRAAVKGSGS